MLLFTDTSSSKEGLGTLDSREELTGPVSVSHDVLICLIPLPRDGYPKGQAVLKGLQVINKSPLQLNLIPCVSAAA